jgi:hypothetical protein
VKKNRNGTLNNSYFISIASTTSQNPNNSSCFSYILSLGECLKLSQTFINIIHVLSFVINHKNLLSFTFTRAHLTSSSFYFFLQQPRVEKSCKLKVVRGGRKRHEEEEWMWMDIKTLINSFKEHIQAGRGEREAKPTTRIFNYIYFRYTKSKIPFPFPKY